MRRFVHVLTLLLRAKFCERSHAHPQRRTRLDAQMATAVFVLVSALLASPACPGLLVCAAWLVSHALPVVSVVPCRPACPKYPSYPISFADAFPQVMNPGCNVDVPGDYRD